MGEKDAGREGQGNLTEEGGRSFYMGRVPVWPCRWRKNKK